MDETSAVFSLQLQCIYITKHRARLSLCCVACTGTNPQSVHEKMTKRTTHVGVVIIVITET